MYTGRIKLGSLIVAIAYMAMVGTTRSDPMVTNNAGVRAGITGFVYRPASNAVGSVAVQWSVVAPTGTNVTSFTIQRSPVLNKSNNWADYIAKTVTGTVPGEASDLANSTNQFYRMRLINFQ
jgi:hypothetical protein